MAEVTGMMLSRALAMEAATIVDGHIDGSGHLILERHDGATIDAGYALVATPDASTTVKGVVELATQAETEARSDSTRAITPAGLDSTIDTINATTTAIQAAATTLTGRVTTVEGVADTGGRQLVSASYTQSSVLTAYPQGYSYLYMTDTQSTTGGWDFGGKYGVVVTYRNGLDLAVQTWYYHATGDSGSPPAYMWIRTANSPSGWSPWSKIATPGMPESVGMTGEIKIWPVNTVPTGWLACDGAAVSRTTYAKLFAILGTTYGAGDGTTTFNTPNMKGRVPVGLDTGQTEFDVIGETGGEKTHTLTVPEMPSHTHAMQGTGALTDGSVGTSYVVNNGSFYGFRTDQPDNTGGGGAHNNLQPYLTVRYIIKT